MTTDRPMQPRPGSAASRFRGAIADHFSPRARGEEALTSARAIKQGHRLNTKPVYTGAATVRRSPGPILLRAGPSPEAAPVAFAEPGTTLAIIDTVCEPGAVRVHTHRGWSDAAEREGQLFLTGNTPMDEPETPPPFSARIANTDNGRCSPDFRWHFNDDAAAGRSSPTKSPDFIQRTFDLTTGSPLAGRCFTPVAPTHPGDKRQSGMDCRVGSSRSPYSPDSRQSASRLSSA